MTLTLYYLPVCPSCRSVLMLAHLLDLPLELKHVDLGSKEHLGPAFLALNPAHTVPLLIDSETGLTLFESRAILSYLMDRYAPASQQQLYPKDAVARAAVDKWLFFNCGTLVPASRPVYKATFVGAEPDAKDVEALSKVLGITDKMLETAGEAAPFVTGDVMTIADLDLLISLDFVVSLVGMELTPYPRLAAWFDRIRREVACYEEISGSKIREFKDKLEAEKREKKEKQ